MTEPTPGPFRAAGAPRVRIPNFGVAQRASLDAIKVALDEGRVFVALVGPSGCGKTAVLEAAVAAGSRWNRRFVRISQPALVSGRLAARIERAAAEQAAKPGGPTRHVVLVVDDAHEASDELLVCLGRLAEISRSGAPCPQVVLVGLPSLWERLADDVHEGLCHRIAIRAQLPALEADPDPWASIEREVSKSTEAAIVPILQARPHVPHPGGASVVSFDTVRRASAAAPAGEVLPPEPPAPVASSSALFDATSFDPDAMPPFEYALFPDPAPAAAAMKSRPLRRFAWPASVALASFAVAVVALSVFDLSDPVDRLLFGVPPPAAMVADARPSPPRQVFPPASPVPTTVAPSQPPVAVASVAPVPAATSPAIAPPAPVVAQAAPQVVAPAVLQPVAVPAVPDVAPRVAGVDPAAKAHLEASALPAAVVSMLVRRGEEQEGLGDLSAARLLFLRAAEAGSATAAFRLARTYDAPFLPSWDASLADPALARSWYERAAAGGVRQASARLAELTRAR